MCRGLRGGFLVVVALAAVAVSACGSGASLSAASRAQERFVALLSTFCRDAKTMRATGPPYEAHLKAELAQARAVGYTARKAPRVATFRSDLAARRRLLTAIHKLPQWSFKRQSHDPVAYMEKAYRLDVRAYDDEKALGLTACLGPPARKPIGG